MKASWFKYSDNMGKAAVINNYDAGAPAFLFYSNALHPFIKYATNGLDIGVVSANGFTDTSTDTVYYEVNLRTPVKGIQSVFVTNNGFKFLPIKAVNDDRTLKQKTQDLMNVIVKNDQAILKKCTLILDALKVARKSKKYDPTEFLAIDRSVQNAISELQARQDAVNKTQGIKATQAKVSGIGVIPLIVWAIVAAVVVASAAIIYWTWKTEPDKQAKTLNSLDKWAEELKQYGVPDEKIQQMKTEVNAESIKDQNEAYSHGKAKGTFDTIFSSVKYVVIGAAGLVLGNMILGHVNKK